jgi:hypothetical protein
MIDFVVKISPEINRDFCQAVFLEVFEENNFESGGIQFHIELKEKVAFQIVDKQTVFHIPVSLKALRKSGLFSTEVKGDAVLFATLGYRVLHSGKVHFEINYTRLDFDKNHKSIHLGDVNLKEDQLIELLVKHLDSFYAAKTEKILKKRIATDDIVDKIKEFINNSLKDNAILGLEPQFHMSAVELYQPYAIEHDIYISFGIDCEAGIVPERLYRDSEIKFKISEAEDKEFIFPIKILIPYENLCDFILKKLNKMDVGGEMIHAKSCRYKVSNQLQFEIDTEEPIEATGIISGLPVYNERTGDLQIDNLKIKITPRSLLHKITAKFLNKIMEDNLKTLFPIQLNELLEAEMGHLLKDLNSRDPNVKLKIKESRVSQLFFNENGVHSVIEVISPTIFSSSGFKNHI